MNDLRIERLSVNLGGNQIIEDISFRVQPGEVVGLIGPNGAGKSTTIRALLGLLENTDGAVRIGSEDLNFIARRERAKRLAYLPQGAPVHWPLTAERAVALGRIPHLSPWQDLSDADDTAIHDAMAKTDCLAFRDRLVTTLSGGERSRVMLARALVVGAAFLLADEPTASLDPLHQLQVMDILRREAEGGAGVIVVMHDLSQAAQYCDKLMLLCGGKMLAEGTPEDVLTDTIIGQAFGVDVARFTDNGRDFLVPSRMLE